MLNIKNILLSFAALLAFSFLFSGFSEMSINSQEIPYSDFIEYVKAGEVSSVLINNQDLSIKGKFKNGRSFTTYNPGDLGLVGDLLTNDVDIVGKPIEGQSIIVQMLISWFPFILLIGIWIFFIRQMQGGGGGRSNPFSFGKSKAKRLGKDEVKTRFSDVAGVDEAKEDVAELVDFLKEPQKFKKLGGRIPKGLLMVGPPGTGKTLLAKAISGEAGVPFYSISGSDFVEMFVGVGAARVRDMFEQAKKDSPCIIFIDEIDAVGRHRGSGMGGGHDEREQTLNQLLVEMDGFSSDTGIIIIAATNRPDVLDPALLRPGRFDRQVYVSLPDILGREEILKIYAKKVQLNEDVVLRTIARATPGFSGADLENMINEAALFAVRSNSDTINMKIIEHAKDKIMMGGERKSMKIDEKDKKLTAYHEAGHAIVGWLSPQHDPIYKISIIPRGRALGVTMFLPEKDKNSMTKREILSQITTLFGGRVAEEMIFGSDQVTTGASNDIERATELARKLVTVWGLSDVVGPIHYGEEPTEVFVGKSMSNKHQSVSEEMSRKIDMEITKIITQSYDAAKKILTDNLEKLHKMSDALMNYETIGESQIKQVMSDQPVSPPEGWEEKAEPAA